MSTVPTPDPTVVAKLEAVEAQLAEVIHTLCAVEAVSNAWREAKATRPDLLADSFLFRTVYDALWDSLVVALGRIWDDDPRSASLPALAKAIKGTRGASAEREHIRKGVHPQRADLHARRIHVVAHRSHPLPAAIDVDNLTARSDVAQIVLRLRLLSDRLGRVPMHWGTTFTEARENARDSLARWRRGDEQMKNPKGKHGKEEAKERRL